MNTLAKIALGTVATGAVALAAVSFKQWLLHRLQQSTWQSQRRRPSAHRPRPTSRRIPQRRHLRRNSLGTTTQPSSDAASSLPVDRTTSTISDPNFTSTALIAGLASKKGGACGACGPGAARRLACSFDVALESTKAASSLKLKRLHRHGFQGPREPSRPTPQVQGVDDFTFRTIRGIGTARSYLAVTNRR